MIAKLPRWHSIRRPGAQTEISCALGHPQPEHFFNKEIRHQRLLLV
jgi:hypothetical protein